MEPDDLVGLFERPKLSPEQVELAIAKAKPAPPLADFVWKLDKKTRQPRPRTEDEIAQVTLRNRDQDHLRDHAARRWIVCAVPRTRHRGDGPQRRPAGR